MKAFFSKRIFSYFIDVFIVVIVSSILTSFIPLSDKAISLYQNLSNLTAQEFESEFDIEKYYDQINNLNYDLSKETVIISLVDIVIYLLYFVVYPVYNNGQTIGKKIMKIKIVNNGGSELSLNNLLLRTLLLYGIARSIILIVLILILNKELFININMIFEYIQILIVIISLFMIIIRKDGRGIHDLVSNTKVVEEEK